MILNNLNNPKEPFNVLVIEQDPDMQNLYEIYFSNIKSQLYFSIVSNVNEFKLIDILSCNYKTNSDLNENKNTPFNFNSTHTFLDIIIIDINASNLKDINVVKDLLKQTASGNLIITTTLEPSIIQERINTLELSKITVLQKPFKFSDLLSVILPQKNKMGKIKLSDHVLGIYDSLEDELVDAMDFIKVGLKSDESTILLIRKDMDINKTSILLKKQGLSNIDQLFKNRSLAIIKNEELYIYNGNVDKDRIKKQWISLVNQSIQSGYKGLRAFCMMDCFFEHCLIEDVLEYETMWTTPLEIPIVPICAYRKNDLDSLSENQKAKLIECHNHMLTS